MPDPNVQVIKDGFARVGVASTQIGDANLVIAGNFTAIKNALTTATTSQEVQDIVDTMGPQIASLEAVAAASTALANNTSDPVPVPVPEPEPLPPVPEGPVAIG